MSGHKWQSVSERKIGAAFEAKGEKVVYQKKFGPYLLDIYLPRLKVCIDVRGPHHVTKDRLRKDEVRSKYLAEMGLMEYVISSQEANIPQEVNRLVKQVLTENTQPPKNQPKKPFNNAIERQLQAMLKHKQPDVD